MSERVYIGVSAFIFDIVFLLHLLRIVFGWQAQIGDFIVPMWVSWVSLAVAGYLAVSAYFLLRKKRPSYY